MDRFTDIASALSQDAHIAVIVADGSGHIRFWNVGATAIFGHPADVALAHRVDLLVPPDYVEMHWAGFNRTIGTRWPGADGFGPIEGLHSSGGIVPVEVMLTPLRDATGLTEGVLALFRRAVG